VPNHVRLARRSFNTYRFTFTDQFFEEGNIHTKNDKSWSDCRQENRMTQVLSEPNDNYDTSLYTIRNRYYYVALTKKF
jgi:hypothetical protein